MEDPPEAAALGDREPGDGAGDEDGAASPRFTEDELTGWVSALNNAVGTKQRRKMLVT